MAISPYVGRQPNRLAEFSREGGSLAGNPLGNSVWELRVPIQFGVAILLRRGAGRAMGLALLAGFYGVPHFTSGRGSAW